MKQLWADPTYRTPMTALRSSSEHKETLRQAMTAWWSNPESRQVRCAQISSARRRHLSQDHQQLLENPQWLADQNNTHTLTEIADYLGCAQSLISAQFKKFGLIPKQHGVSYTGGEQQIIAFVESLGVHTETRTRAIISPYEIDVYLPEHRVGIEYHGAYWHSYNTTETTEQRRRHSHKRELAEQQQVRLLQFWDIEWTTRPDICKSIIRSALGLSTTIAARKCRINEPTSSEVRTFLETNHMQGHLPSYTIAAGLYYQNELVMVMTVGKSRYQQNSWEILRMASRLNCVVVGGAQRLWKHLRSQIPSGATVTTYSDRRLFTGDVYTTMGFVKKADTPPSYCYYLDGQLYSRLQFQKHKLQQKLVSYDATLTEAENMFRAGYRRLWDAGQGVWVCHV